MRLARAASSPWHSPLRQRWWRVLCRGRCGGLSLGRSSLAPVKDRRSALCVAPLCPAGHLPLKGGDWTPALLSPISGLGESAEALKLPISPLEGEMSGRTEGGAKECRHAGKIVLRLVQRYRRISARNRSTAISTRSGVAGASRRGQTLWSATLATASDSACSTDIASMNGG